MSNSEQKIEYEEILRERKRMSRNEETLVYNGLLYLLVKMGFDAQVKKTKKTIHTIKMLIVEEIKYRPTGKVLNQAEIAYFSQFLLSQLGYTPLKENSMTLKQLKRSREAQLNNALLYILSSIGFTFDEKKSKKSKCTERLIRILKLEYDGFVFTKELLCKLGESIEKTEREQLVGSIVTITKESLNDFDIIIPSCSFDSILNKAISIPYTPKIKKQLKTIKSVNEQSILNVSDKKDMSIKSESFETINDNSFNQERIITTPINTHICQFQPIALPLQMVMNYYSQIQQVSSNTPDINQINNINYNPNSFIYSNELYYYPQSEYVDSAFAQGYYC
ncbi:hypothetical protein EHI8A_239870 [Entamoeba histolytica HM-1:IMSS-B]|uniref:Uncharacterized protein n=2 Tax=Entamoeba histolytica TaxID=5759 RepID=A0A175JTB3_ENTHI|nr:hypothetical protein EHI8A_239870 [Entamoeba histolytica HM-1:IMSS-B]GAT96712.1 hypothetical protein CL6EHI_001900 [Entamoeba histolytica]